MVELCREKNPNPDIENYCPANSAGNAAVRFNQISLLDGVFLCDLDCLQLLILVLFSAGLLAQTPAWAPAPGHITLSLWPSTAPAVSAETNTTTAKDTLIAGSTVVRLGNVTHPTITLYSPAGNATALPWWFFRVGPTASWRLI